MIDMFPQLVETFDADHGKSPLGKYWYPTLVLNMDVKKALPPEGVEFLFVRVRAKKIRNGRFDLEAVVLDEHGDVVVISHHISLILDVKRNLAKRGHKRDEAVKKDIGSKI